MEPSQLIANWIPNGARVADIGCGLMAMEELIRGGSYHPVDFVKRDARTLVLDLDKDRIPDDLLQKVDHATLLGILENLGDPQCLLRQLSAAGITVVCSYQPSELSTPQLREQNDWITSYRTAEFPLVLHRCGFEIIQSCLIESQGFYLVRPAAPKFRSPVVTPAAKSRKTLVLSGFFGRGNVGDESLLQVQYEQLSPYFEIVVSVEEHGAYDGFWNWYPYNQCRIVQPNHTDIFFSEDVVGLHIGGGDLGFGFNGEQMIAALTAGKKVCLSGVDAGISFKTAAARNPRLLRNLLGEISCLSARTAEGHVFFKNWSPRAVRGADWAFGLKSDQCPDSKSGLTLVVLRETPAERITPDYRRCVARLLESLAEKGHDFALLPFSPEDEHFYEHVEATWAAPCERHWWNARRVKQLIEQANLVISVGRLHPLIFSASVGTPCVFADISVDVTKWNGGNVTKARVFCEENGMPYFPTFSELCDWFDQSMQLPPAVRFSAEYGKYFENMVSEVLAAFSSKAVKKKPAC